MGEEFHLIIALQLDLGYLFIGPSRMYLLHVHEGLRWKKKKKTLDQNLFANVCCVFHFHMFSIEKHLKR